MAIPRLWTASNPYVAGLDAPMPVAGHRASYADAARRLEREVEYRVTRTGADQRHRKIKS